MGREGSNGRASGRRPHLNLTFPSSLARGARAVAAAAAAELRGLQPRGRGWGSPGSSVAGPWCLRGGLGCTPSVCTPALLQPHCCSRAQVRLPRGGATHPACIHPGLELEPSCTSLQVGNILEDTSPHPPPGLPRLAEACTPPFSCRGRPPPPPLLVQGAVACMEARLAGLDAGFVPGFAGPQGCSITAQRACKQRASPASLLAALPCLARSLSG